MRNDPSLENIMNMTRMVTRLEAKGCVSIKTRTEKLQWRLFKIIHFTVQLLHSGLVDPASQPELSIIAF